MELIIMKPYFEYSDTLNSPYEAFIFEAEHSEIFPIRSHWHYFMEIIYLIEGQAYVEAGKETCRMTVCRFESGLLHESLAKEYHNILFD